MDTYYKIKLEQGQYYQDYVCEELYKVGLPLINYASKEFQNTIGENKAGIEIKYDDRFKFTGNLYIEVAEKSKYTKLNYTDSGIYRNDNAWLYVIGDLDTIFIFGKNILKMIYEQSKAGKMDWVIPVQTQTSQGFLLPKDKAMQFASKIIYCNKI